MHEQGFEDGVRKKMEELSFSPSAPVWLQVEAQIRRKNKRRRLLLFWLLPLLLSGSFLLYKAGSKKEKSLGAISATTTIAQGLPQQKKREFPETKPDIKAGKANKEVARLTATPIHPSLIYQTKKEAAANVKALRSVINRQEESRFNTNETIVVKTTTSKSNADEVVKTDVANPIKTTADSTAFSSLAVLVDTISKPATLTELTNLATIDSTVGTPKLSSPDEKKWHWSIEANAGLSNLKQSFLGGQAAFDRSSPLTSNPMTPASGTATILRKGAAFSIGANLDRKLNSRLKFRAGLQYAYYSTRLGVGQKVTRDTSIITGGLTNNRQDISSYYNPGNTKEYTNKYHFIQLPVGIEWNMLRSAPLSLNVGISISRLLTTNQLEAASTGTLYYRTSNGLNKTGIQFFGALTYRVWQNAKHTLHLGPYLQWGLTPLQGDAAGKRFLFTGVQTKFSF